MNTTAIFGRLITWLTKSHARRRRRRERGHRLWVEALENRYLLADAAHSVGTDDTATVRIADDNGAISSDTYVVVDTGQTAFYNNSAEIAAPAQGDAFYGQDAQYDGNLPSYTLSTDGLTVDDNVTGLTWTQSPDLDGDGDIDANDKLTFTQFQTYVDTLNAQNYGGYSDWRAPTIKDLYSLIDFSGLDPSGYNGTNTSGLTPFIDTDYFDFGYGDTAAGERIIDAQFWSSTEYVSTTMFGDHTVFGVNFADGRIKGYGTTLFGRDKTEYAYFVRGNTEYGVNDFTDNGDGTITDAATGLMWAQDDSGVGMDWEDALAWVQQMNDASYLGYSDWRLPNAKELQSTVDYSRSPDTTNSAAIDPVFNVTAITDEGGNTDYPYYWSSTTHANWFGGGQSAAYIAFGEAEGYMMGFWLDVHGAGSQRSDPKAGDASDYPTGHGPQGDAIRINNFVRVVRDTESVEQNIAPTAEASGPYSAQPGDTITLDATASTDADGSITAYAWDLDNDGQYDDVTGATADFRADTAGTFTVGLRVTDDDGATDIDTATINIGQVTAAFEGYTLFSPLGSQDTYLIDNGGVVVHSWTSDYAPGLSMYLLEDGTLMRTASLMGPNQWFAAGGASGRVEQWSWDGELLWEFEYSDGYHRLHHDIEVLPNGNVLMIAWEFVDEADAIAAGRDPSLLSDGELWPDHIIEVEPTGSSGGNIVWEWHAWDHLVQDYDSSKDSYGVVADHPELIDVNYVSGRESADWNHTNSIDYNSDLDQVLLSVRSFNEIWVIDHSTTSEEAAGHTGGDLGMGGDLLYRWGNPQAYDTGTADDQVFFGQHDAEWIGDGIPGEDNILVFNNGSQIAGRAYSSVDEIATPLGADGSYTLVAGQAYGPDDLAWSYAAEPATSFYADHISGSQRLANGNTLITDGISGILFEVTTGGEVIWEYDTGGQVFRADRYAPNYAGFDGTPLDDNPTNQAPLADAGGPYRGDVGSTIALSGSGSSDSDGSISLYEWDLDNDGQYDDATGATASFNAATDGTFTVGLQVTDNEGASDTDTATVTVSDGTVVVDVTYAIVDTGQMDSYDDVGNVIDPSPDEAFYGQDGGYDGNQPSYATSADGLTVDDNVTGLTWTQNPNWDGDGDIDTNDKFTWGDAQAYVDTLNAENYGGYNDWRLPSIKELYSLIDFSGVTGMTVATAIPYIDTDYFAFGHGDEASGERIIDAQYWSSTEYVSTTMNGSHTVFGVNFADGRIKGYGTSNPMGSEMSQYVRYVRGNTDYGENDFVAGGEGTVTDNATGLMWAQDDSGLGMDWEDALAWVQQMNETNYLGYSDWRLPNAKELQSIVDYSRSPDTTGSAAIDSAFNVSTITDGSGDTDYPFFWTSTTHLDGPPQQLGNYAAYVAFGEAEGWMWSRFGGYQLQDVHGAGAQRSDPKSGDPGDYPYGHGPQGDVIGIYNYVRLVRDADVTDQIDPPVVQPDSIGVHRDSGVYLDLDMNSQWNGGSDQFTSFGASGDILIVGDWNGDGVDEIGVRRGESYYFDINGNGLWDGATGGDRVTYFGTPTDELIIGDWDGNGTDDLGVRRGSDYFRDGNSNGSWDGVSGGDVLTSFGIPDDVLIIGDWDGDGTDDLGVHRQDWFYRDGNSNGVWDGVAGGDLLSSFGSPTDVAIVGNWNNDTTDDIGVRHGSLYFRDGNGDGNWNGVAGGDLFSSFGISTDTLILGDWDGNGTDDLGVRRGNEYYRDGNSNGVWDEVAGGDIYGSYGNPDDTLVIGAWPSASPLLAAETESSEFASTASLRFDQLTSIVDAAIEIFSESGLSPTQLQNLNSINVQIVDLDSGLLGQTVGNLVTIDVDATGNGWFVDPTPTDNEEFELISDQGLMAIGESAAANRNDLLTVVLHELGHVLGLDDDYTDDSITDVMHGWLRSGIRRMPNSVA